MPTALRGSLKRVCVRDLKQITQINDLLVSMESEIKISFNRLRWRSSSLDDRYRVHISVPAPTKNGV